MRMFDQEACTGCGACIPMCPKQIIRLSEEHNQKGTVFSELTDPSACINCRRCETICPDGAVWFDSPTYNGMVDHNKLAPHTGCNLGNLAFALGSAIKEMKLEDKAIIFKKKTVEANTFAETHDYQDNSFFEDALNFKHNHPDRVVIAVCSSAKEIPYTENKKRYSELGFEKITIIQTLNWFTHSGNFKDVGPSAGNMLEEIISQGKISFAARACVSTPEDIMKLKSYIKTALQYQLDGKNFSIVEMVFPCYYRLLNRPQVWITPDQMNVVRDWFEHDIKPRFRYGILKEDNQEK
jgi:ferredoxin